MAYCINVEWLNQPFFTIFLGRYLSVTTSPLHHYTIYILIGLIGLDHATFTTS